MIVKLLKEYASPTQSGSPGKVIEVSDDEGRLLVDGNYAVPASREEAAPFIERARKAAEDAAHNVEAFVVKPIASPTFRADVGDIIRVTREQFDLLSADETLRTPTIEDRRNYAQRNWKTMSTDELTREIWELKVRLEKLEAKR